MVFLILTYLAGILTILSPCILPVLPFVFAKSEQSFLKNGLPLLGGMSLTFSVLSALAIVGGEWIAQLSSIGRIIAIILFGFFGLSLIFPHFSEKLLTPLTRLGSRLNSGARENNPMGSFFIGVGTGLLWAPCAGPILGLVLTGAASQENVLRSMELLFSYSLGAATSLAIALLAGNKFFQILKKFLGFDQFIKKGIGIAVLIGVLAIVFKLDQTVLTQVSKFETASLENKLLSYFGADQKPEEQETTQNSMMMMSAKPQEQKRVEGILPELSGAVAWLNTKPLTKEDLFGKVVLIDFWTYSCINCLRTLPFVKAWAEKYKDDGLVVIGVHTPEFAFEKSAANVQNAVKDLGITYPVALDSEYKIWNAFQNNYWPAHYFIDRQGRIRHHHFGEGGYEESEKIIRELLTENGGSIQPKESEIHGEGVEASASLQDIQSPETYVGYGRAKNFVFLGEEKYEQATQYQLPSNLVLNQWALSGTWHRSEEKATLLKVPGKILFRFQARDLHLVLGSNKKIKFKVSIDGHAPLDDHGVDTDRNGFGEVQEHRLYQLIRQKKEADEHLFEIEFFNPGVDVYAFTFG